MIACLDDAAELMTTAEVIVLGGSPVIRIKRGPYLLGYFGSPADAQAVGIELADVEITT